MNSALGANPEIRPEQSLELLKELHILTRDGKLNQDSRRKLKQVYHLYQFIEPLLAEVMAQRGDLTLVDHGAGKSYLGFIIYELYFKALKTGHIYGIETRAELVQKSRELAARLGFERLTSSNLPLAAATNNVICLALVSITELKPQGINRLRNAQELHKGMPIIRSAKYQRPSR